MKNTRRNSPWSILLLVFALGIFTACEERPAVDEPIVEDDEYALEGQTGPSVSEITSNPETYEGQVVTLQAEVSEVLDGTAFRLSEGTFGDGLLVVVRRSMTPNDRPDAMMPVEGEEAQVRGTVTLLTRSEIEQQYQLDLDDDMDVADGSDTDTEGEMDADTERHAVLIAESVTRAADMGAGNGAFGADAPATDADDRVARDSEY